MSTTNPEQTAPCILLTDAEFGALLGAVRQQIAVRPATAAGRELAVVAAKLEVGWTAIQASQRATAGSPVPANSREVAR
jgi:hypothetical protein